ncbi:MAG: ATP-binding protein [Ruminococcus sp.]|nr:ATP-binding protein [Ruminococcus sp.]MCM1381201.1 ATP-binding protein [Muribaculaceae bacterium]MCM1478729.1 ATP-binding protein [Muribaculaceae bacterium]
MGIYLNPGNELFMNSAGHSKVYVDKTMLIKETNDMLFGESRHICVSRPRRFGKSMTANMLAAYYSRGCDSRELFGRFNISKSDSFEKHLNKYNVIHISMKDFADMSDSVNSMIDAVTNLLTKELLKEYPNVDYLDDTKLPLVLTNIFMESGIPFVFIIDEWDCVFRIFKTDTEGQTKYLSFLRNLLKDKPYAALDYATGILPVKKYGEHSALNMYAEYSMANQAMFAEYTGFTADDVAELCKKFNMPAEKMAQWYDGYKVGCYEIYNPQSVVRAVDTGIFDSYWTKTETFEALQMYIKINMDGLRQAVIRMIAGEHIPVNTGKFQNDMVTVNSADDVLTLLIHLGYLTYDFDTKTAWIPNREVQQEFINCIEDGGWEEVTNALKQSDELLAATLSCNSGRVAEILEEVHRKNTSIIAYKNEMSLSVTLALAYYSAKNSYEIFRELPSGNGFADLTFIPRKGVDSPAMVIELKYEQTASKALEQIKRQKYTEKLTAFSGEILLVGINFDEKKGHSCVIEKIKK